MVVLEEVIITLETGPTLREAMCAEKQERVIGIARRALLVTGFSRTIAGPKCMIKP